MDNPQVPRKKLGLVLAGGGARGAYGAGVIHYIRSQLPKHIAFKRNFDIICGSSVGAINTCFIASTSHDLHYQGEKIRDLWTNLNQDEIYLRDMGALTRFLGRTFHGVFQNLISRKPKGSFKRVEPVHFRGLLDTSPFPHFLRRVIPWKQINLNIQNGLVKAISVTATNAMTGKMELFIDKHPSMIYSGRYQAHYGPMEVQHAVASAAIPIVFPAVKVGGSYYSDGGVKANTPVSPAIQLGADKILVLGLHHKSEQASSEFITNQDIPPTMGQMIGNIMQTFFSDKLDYDLAQMERINLMIDAGEKVFGPTYIPQMNEYLRQSNPQKDISIKGIKQVRVTRIFPSQDVRKILDECTNHGKSLNKNLKTYEKMILKVLDVDIKQGLDFLSFILFLPEYMKKLIELGYEDARAKHDELIAFFEE